MRLSALIAFGNAAAFTSGALAASGLMLALLGPGEMHAPSPAPTLLPKPQMPAPFVPGSVPSAPPAVSFQPAPRQQKPDDRSFQITADAAPAAKAKLPQGRYLIQLGVFSNSTHLKHLQEALQAAGLVPEIRSLSSAHAQLRLVVLSGFADRGAAAETAALVTRQTGLVPLIVRSPAL
jgi:cell division septation protein DedD